MFFSLWRKKKELELEVQTLSRKVQFFEEDKKRLIDQMKQDQARELAHRKKEAEIQFTELKSLTNLESQQKIAQAELNHKIDLNVIKSKYDKEYSTLESKLAKEYYEKMQVALKDLTINGSEQSKFVQELALKMFDKGMEKPMPSHFITESRVDVAKGR